MAIPSRPSGYYDGNGHIIWRQVVIPYNTVEPPPPPSAYRPLSVTLTGSTSASYLTSLQNAGLDVPADANYVKWPYSSPDGAFLDTVFATLGANDVLILPEATRVDGTAWPYRIDSSNGFMYAANDPRHNHSMARFTRGLVGCGPKTIITTSVSSFSAPPQGDVYTDPITGVSTTKGGNKNCVIETSTVNPYFGNLEFQGRSFGGVAFDGVRFAKGIYSLEYVFFNAPHRGFKNSPNGEAGGWTVRGGPVRNAGNFEVECRDSTGARVGSSPWMLNSLTGAYVHDAYVHHSVAGMPTAWTVTSTASAPVKYERVRSEFNGSAGGGLNGSCFNFEICNGTFELVDCTLINNYLGNYDSTQGTGNSELHLSGGSATAQATINLRNCKIDQGPRARNTGANTTATGKGPFADGTFTVALQQFGYTPQQGFIVNRFGPNGERLPVAQYTPNGVVLST